MCSEADQLLDILLCIFHGEHHHLDIRFVLLNPFTDLLTSHHWHVQVDEGDIRGRVLYHADQLPPVRRLTNFAYAAERLDQADEPFAEEHMVVRQVNPDFGRTLHWCRFGQTITPRRCS